MSPRSALGVLVAALLALVPSPAPAEAAGSVSTGAALFGEHCGLCHAAGGTGTFMLARRLGKERSLLLDRSDLAPEYVTQVVRHGLQAMPRFTRVELTDRELAAIAAFLAIPGRRAP